MKFKVFVMVLSLLVHVSVSQDVGYDRDALQQLTQYRQLHRKTADGRLCAAAFVQDDQTYTDCTTAKAPDGTTGREWCWVEVQLLDKGPRGWEFCQSSVNYDVVRSKARDAFASKAKDVEDVVDILKGESQRLRDTLKKYDETCGAIHKVVPGRIEHISQTVRGITHEVGKLEARVSKYDMVMSTMEQVKEDIKKDLFTALHDKLNCESERGYEDDPIADGLRGSYYSNGRFDGTPVTFRDDTAINFEWDKTPPAKNIPFQHFSVRWDGWLLAPETAEYILSTETDCGARVFLDDAPVVVDRMPIPTAEDDFGEKPVRVLPPSETTGFIKSESSPQMLQGGVKYKLRVEYFHLSSMRFANPDLSLIKLLWRTDAMEEKVIPQKYFFKGNPKKPLKLSGLDASKYDVTLLENGAGAFIDSQEFFIADVPLLYEGRKVLRTVQSPDDDSLKFELSADANVLFAFPKAGTLPVSNSNSSSSILEWSDTGDLLSVYKSKSNAVQATESITMSIYQAKTAAAVVELSLLKGVPFLIFFDPLKENIHTCYGELQDVSLTDGEYFESCTASSEISEMHGCKAGLSGKNIDTPYGTWQTSSGNGKDEWILVTFKQPIELIAFQFKPRSDPLTWPTEMELQFTGSKDVERIAVQHADHTYQLKKSRITRSVKVLIVRMQQGTRASDTGGSFSFKGIPCSSETKAAQEIPETLKLISISFHAKSAGLQSKIKIDDGSVKHPHDQLIFGWDKPAKPVDTSRCQSEMIRKNITDSGIQFPPPPESSLCIEEQNCTPNSWSIDLPHYGIYRVTVKVGFPCKHEGDEKQRQFLQVNGIPFFSGELLGPEQYAEATGEIECVSTASIKLTADCLAGDVCSDSLTVINHVEIERLEPHLAKVGVTA